MEELSFFGTRTWSPLNAPDFTASIEDFIPDQKGLIAFAKDPYPDSLFAFGCGDGEKEGEGVDETESEEELIGLMWVSLSE